MFKISEERSALVAKTIEWVNSTFGPVWGLKPIEDLPQAIMASGTSCVIARVLKDNIPIPDELEWFVGSYNVSLQKKCGEYSSDEEKEIWEMPDEVSQFIREFDHGLLPHLVELEDNQIVLECTLCQERMVVINDYTPEQGYSHKALEHLDDEHPSYVDENSTRTTDEGTGKSLIRMTMEDTFKVVVNKDILQEN